MLNYEEVLDHIVERVGRLVPIDAACILLIDGDTARVARWNGYLQFGTEGSIAAARFNIPANPTLSSVRETGELLVARNVESSDAWVLQSGQSWIKAHTTIPIDLTVHGTRSSSGTNRDIIGFLHLDSATPGTFSEVDLEFLQAFVDQAAVALANARLIDHTRQEVIERVRALKMERNFIYAILDIAGALIVILNAGGRILRFNRACEIVTGYSLEEVRGKRIWDLFLISEEIETVKTHFEQLRRGQVPSEYEGIWITKGGERRLISWSNTVLFDNSGEVEYIISTGLDITERKQMEEALRESEERYALAALSASDGLWDWNLKTNQIYYSSRWKAMLGYEEDQIGDNPIEWFSRVHPDDLEQLKADIVAHLEGSPTPFKNEHRILHQDGSYRWVLSQGLSVRNENAPAHRMAGSQTDITHRKLAEAQLMHSAFHDALTGLPNRSLFRERLELAIEQAKEDQKYLFAVLFLDLDRFKVVNDSLGHIVGDQILIATARRLKAHLRADDMVARLGGDEFAILLSGIPGPNEAIHIAERIQNGLALPINLEEHRVFTTTSIGIALSTTDYDWPEDILRDADMAMYQAKTMGRARHEIFQTDLRTQLEQIWQLEAELRQAIEHDEFQLYYQPIVSLAEGHIAGVEALLRWRHPERGLIDPDRFIPLAEEIGMIASIGAWVLQTACDQVADWYAAGHTSLRVSVNVSPYQLQQPPHPDRFLAKRSVLLELVKGTLKKTGLPPRCLELEITESMVMLNHDYSLAILKALCDLGVQIAVDDFGMGSALDLLRYYPISTLKIDQSFVKDMTGEPDDEAFITAIIAMAHSLKLKVVAEGVETEAQLTLLKTQQCDEVQGYLFSPPLSAERMTNLLQAVRRLPRGLRGS